MAIGYKEQSAASVPTPSAGEQYTFIDSADGKVKRKDSTGSVTPVESAGNNAAAISFTPSGDLVATNVQDAIEELDTEKAPLSHVGSTGVSQHGIATSLAAGFMSPADKIKLDAFNLTDVVGSLNYKGVWNASTNAPALASSVGTKGHYYVVSVAGATNLDGITDWKPNDWVIYNGTIWQKLDDSASKEDIGLGNVDNTADLDKPISNATQAALDLKANLTQAISQLTGEVTAGPGGGSQAATISNSAVINKVLTGLTQTFGVVQATDTILQAISKLANTTNLHAQEISADLTVPSDYTLISCQTRVTGSTNVRILSGGIFKII